MKPRTIEELHKYVGSIVKVEFKHGKIEQGKLGFTKEFSEKYGYRRPGYFTINDTDFKLSHIVSLEVEVPWEQLQPLI